MKKIINYKSGLSVNIQCLNISSYPLHYHDDLQLLFVLDGELELSIIYTKYILVPGSMHIIHSGDVHSLKSITQDNVVLIINFNEKYFTRILPHFKDTIFVTRLSSNSNTNIQRLYDKIFSIVCEEHDKDRNYISNINNSAVSFLNYLTKNYRGFLIEEQNLSFVYQNQPDFMQIDRISRVVTYIYENYQDKITLSDIADNESVNQQYLSRLFHNIVGLSFRDFLSMVRIENSLWQILSTDKSISKISMDTGFSDSKYFVAQFHKFMGLHPKEYKKTYKSHTINNENPAYEEIEYNAYIKYINFFTDKVIPKSTFITNIDFDYKKFAEVKASDKKLYDTENIFLVLNAGFDKISDISFLINSAYQTKKDESIQEIYKASSPQKQLIDFIEYNLNYNSDLLNSNKIAIWDNPGNPNSLFMKNGLKKPLYHFFDLCSKLAGNAVSKGDSYILFKNNDSISILLLNSNSENDMEYNINIKNADKNIKQTNYLLSSHKSCINYLSQLNFKSDLSRDEIEEINKMTAPDISYKIIPKSKSYNYSIILNPLDMLLIYINLC